MRRFKTQLTRQEHAAYALITEALRPWVDNMDSQLIYSCLLNLIMKITDATADPSSVASRILEKAKTVIMEHGTEVKMDSNKDEFMKGLREILEKIEILEKGE